jgi:hypothetical protein
LLTFVQVPTTEDNETEIQRRAPIFLSAFESTAGNASCTLCATQLIISSLPVLTAALWRTTTPSSKALPLVVNSREHTENSEDTFVSPATVYLRQRFPNLRFEWNLEHTGHELKALCDSASPFTIKTPWSACLRAGHGAVNASRFSRDTCCLIELTASCQCA